MQVKYQNGIFILYPKSNKYKLKKKDSDEEVYYEVVYLGKFSNPNEYEDISIYQIEGYEEELINIKSDIDVLNDISNEQDTLIIDLAAQLAILKLTL